MNEAPRTGNSDTDDDTVYIAVTYPDGTVARWAFASDSPLVDQLETVLGTPDTLKV